jgi:hypothetical protein
MVSNWFIVECEVLVPLQCQPTGRHTVWYPTPHGIRASVMESTVSTVMYGPMLIEVKVDPAKRTEFSTSWTSQPTVLHIQIYSVNLYRFVMCDRTERPDSSPTLLESHNSHSTKILFYRHGSPSSCKLMYRMRSVVPCSPDGETKPEVFQRISDMDIPPFHNNILQTKILTFAPYLIEPLPTGRA